MWCLHIIALGIEIIMAVVYFEYESRCADSFEECPFDIDFSFWTTLHIINCVQEIVIFMAVLYEHNYMKRYSKLMNEIDSTNDTDIETDQQALIV